MPSFKKHEDYSNMVFQIKTIFDSAFTEKLIQDFSLEYNSTEEDKFYDNDFTAFICKWLNEYYGRFQIASDKLKNLPNSTQTINLLDDISVIAEHLKYLLENTSSHHKVSISDYSKLSVYDFWKIEEQLQELSFGSAVAKDKTQKGKGGNKNKTSPLNYLALSLTNLYKTYTLHLPESKRKGRTAFVRQCIHFMDLYGMNDSKIDDAITAASSLRQSKK